MQVNIDAAQIENSTSEKLLGVTIDAKLSFKKYIEQVHVKALIWMFHNRKLNNKINTVHEL